MEIDRQRSSCGGPRPRPPSRFRFDETDHVDAKEYRVAAAPMSPRGSNQLRGASSGLSCVPIRTATGL